jgi:tripartite-type tricarboxylate transporter receptor subunit TctC
LAAVAVGLTGSAMAAWPEKPIKLIVPFKAGGTSDQTGRVFQAAIQENNLLPQPITIINVGAICCPSRSPSSTWAATTRSAPGG